MGAEPETTVDPNPGGDMIEVTFEFEPPLTNEKLRERLQPIVENAEDSDQ